MADNRKIRNVRSRTGLVPDGAGCWRTTEKPVMQKERASSAAALQSFLFYMLLDSIRDFVSDAFSVCDYHDSECGDKVE